MIGWKLGFIDIHFLPLGQTAFIELKNDDSQFQLCLQSKSWAYSVTTQIIFHSVPASFKERFNYGKRNTNHLPTD